MAGKGASHTYDVAVVWNGDRGTGTSGYKDYDRDHTITAVGKPPIQGSSDPAFRGDASRWNPEDLLVASVSACHKLWYLHMCAVNGVAVLAYRDDAVGTMVEDPATGGRFTRVLLRPRVTIRGQDDPELARRLHGEAHAHCFVANSVNFAVEHEAVIERRMLGGGAITDAPTHSGDRTAAMRGSEGSARVGSLAEVRDNIDRLDRAIVRLMAERGTFVERAARFKDTRAAVAAPDRVERVIGNVRALATEAGLEPEVAEATYRAMIARFVAMEERAFERIAGSEQAP